MGYWFVGVLIAVPLLIAVIGDIVARKQGRPVRVDPEVLKLRRGSLRKRGHGLTGTAAQRIYASHEKWDDGVRRDKRAD